MTIPRPTALSDEINFRIRLHFDTRDYNFYIGNYKSPPPDTAILAVARESFLWNVALAWLTIIERSSRLTRDTNHSGRSHGGVARAARKRLLRLWRISATSTRADTRQHHRRLSDVPRVAFNSPSTYSAINDPHHRARLWPLPSLWPWTWFQRQPHEAYRRPIYAV